MKKIIALFAAALPFAAVSASNYADNGFSAGRVGMQVNRVGAAGRPTVPVTTTTTTNISIPAVDETNTTSNTINVDISAARAACLMTAGNIWASKMNVSQDGISTDALFGEDAEPGNNSCFSAVSVRSRDIKNMGRFFPPRYFQVGGSAVCGSWLDEAALDDAILDAKKSARTAGTIAAAVGGAGLGVGLTELIGQNIKGGKTAFMGQKGLDDRNKQLVSLMKSLKKKNPGQWDKYSAAVKNLDDACKSKNDNNCLVEGIKVDEIMSLVNEVNRA
jgi:hypothetical protein